jgi:hypothetical protein
MLKNSGGMFVNQRYTKAESCRTVTFKGPSAQILVLRLFHADLYNETVSRKNLCLRYQSASLYVLRLHGL